MDMHKLTTKEILNKNQQRCPPSRLTKVIIILHDVRSMHNVGAVFRNCDAFGISELILSGFTPIPPRPEISKTAIGAERFVDWRFSKDLNKTIQELKEDNYHLIGMEQTSMSQDITRYLPPADKDICILFGNEVTGIDNDLLTCIDHFIEIPQFGKKHSLNVSVSTGITLYAFLAKFIN